MVNNNFNVMGPIFRPNPGSTHFQSRAQGISVGEFLSSNNQAGNQFSGVSTIVGSPHAPQDRMRSTISIAQSLRTSVNNITGQRQSFVQNQVRNAPSPFNSARAESANTDLMRVTGSDANRLRNTDISAMNVDIIQTAQAQRNEGDAMRSTQRAVEAGFTEGNNRMSLNVGNRTFNIDFNVRENDTVRDVQDRIASAVNARGAGVTASVTTDRGASTLVLESDRTGETNTFSITDTTGNAAARAGITGVTQEAQNAEFRVNRGNITGFLQTSETNDVSLGHGITAELRGEGNVQITAGRDELGQINAFRDFVNNFNSFMENIQNNTTRNTGIRPGRDLANNQGADRIERDLRNLVNANAQDLANIGITMTESGRLRIDQERMDEAARSGELEAFARNEGSGNGFLNRVSRIADNVANNPANVVNNQNQGRNNSDDIFGGMNIGSLNIAQFTRISSMANLGMLFDSLF